MDTIERIEKITFKLKQVVSKLQALEFENARLKKDKEALESELFDRNVEIKQYEAQLIQTKQDLGSRVEREEEQTAKFKSAIDHYTKEIDRCIEWLTNN